MQLGFLKHRFRGAAILGLALVFLMAAAASASSPEAGERGRYRGQCKKLTKQIDHFENTILPMALDRGNYAWANATNDQVERLWNRRADLCPAYGAERTAMRKAADNIRRFNKLVAAAGRAAVTYFSGGVLP
ncbi:MAG: hypothetical protein AB8G23_22665 [Myxococcota bacterium]